MKTTISATSLRHFKSGFTALFAAVFIIYTFSASAQNSHQGDVSALGRLQPLDGVINIGVPSTSESISGSMLTVLYVKEGDVVEAGMLLAITDSAAVLDAKKTHAMAGYQMARLAAVASQSQADEACVLADVAEREADRRVRLLDQKLASEEETETALGHAEATAASCTAAQAHARVAESKIDVTNASVAVAQAQLDRAYIKAPFDGRILHVLVQPGEFVGADGFLELGRTQKMYAIAEVYETDIRRVKVGQTAIIRSAVLSEDLSGTVELIRHIVRKQDVTGTDPAAGKDARIIEVEILLDDSQQAASLTHLQVEIIIDV